MNGRARVKIQFTDGVIERIDANPNADSTMTLPVARPLTDARPARVFIGLKVAAEAAGEIAELARPLECCGVRLVPRSDIHLTLVPP